MEQQGVESIEFRWDDATTEQVEAIFQGLRNNTSLHELHVPHTRPPVDMSILLALLTVNNTLQELTLGDDDLDDHVMEQLSVGLQANRSVTRLTLQCHITDTGAQHLATMLAVNKTIQELNLSSIYSGDHAMEKLSTGLQANGSVTKLKLRITDTGAHHFATMLAVNNTLQELDLSHASITDIVVVNHLSRALQHNISVTHLNLSCNMAITNTGAVALGEMLRVNKSLRELNLRGTSVGEEGATALMEGLQHNQVLKIPRRLKKNRKLYGSVKRKNLKIY